MNDIFSYIQSRLVDGREQQCLANDGRGSFLLLAIPVAYLFIYALASLRKYKNPYPPSPSDIGSWSSLLC